jgi:NADPH:quinone reductase
VHRVVCRDFGPAMDLEVVEEPTPAPGPGEVLIEVDGAAASFVDGLIVRGGYQLRPPLPFTPGSAVAGRVAEPGAGSDAMVTGDPVAALLLGFGGFASHVVVPASAAIRVPAAIGTDVAASVIENYGTLQFALDHRVEITRDQWVVVLGAGGAIGLAAVDVAHSLGARVVAVASSPEKRSAALAAGANLAVDGDDLRERIRSITGRGADIVIDPVGGPSSEAALRALAPDGRLCVLGFASGEIPRLPTNIILLQNRTVIGVDWGAWARADPGAAQDLVTKVLCGVARGALHPPAPTTMPMTEAREALGRLATRQASGKIVLRP